MSDIIPQKTCNKCGNQYPATTDHFRRYGAGFTSPCKKCVAINKREWRQNNPNKVREQKKRNYEKQRDHFLEYYREWSRAHKEQRRLKPVTPEQRERSRVQAAKWYAENKERASKSSASRYLADPQAAKDRIKDYLKRNPHKQAQFSKVSTQNRRARELAAEGTFTAADIRLQYRAQRGKCWHCSKPVGDKYHVDHLRPLAKGGTNDPRNLVISCPTCNLSKGDRQTWEWNGRLF